MRTSRFICLTGGALAFLAVPAVAIDQALPQAATEAVPPFVETSPDDTYLDDRSTPVELIRSLYNSINRHEYLRAWSYFSEESGRADFPAFQKGYETTGGAKLKLGDPVSDGAAGSIYTRVPTVIEATGTDGVVRVFAGCYETRMVQPANQATPPFVPLQITKATLRPARTKFDETSGDCQVAGE